MITLATTFYQCGTTIPKMAAIIPKVTSTVIDLLKIGVPVLLIIFGMIDFGKAAVSHQEDEIKKNQQIFLKRLLTGSLVFFIFIITEILFNFVASGQDSIWDCVNCFINGPAYCEGYVPVPGEPEPDEQPEDPDESDDTPEPDEKPDPTPEPDEKPDPTPEPDEVGCWECTASDGLSGYKVNYYGKYENAFKYNEYIYECKKLSLKRHECGFIEEPDDYFTMLPAAAKPKITSKAQNCRCHPTKKIYKPHFGIDIKTAYDTPIYAFDDGTVQAKTVQTQYECESSKLTIKHTTDDGKTYYTQYIHMNRASNDILKNLKKGDTITKGQIIGYVGGTRDEDACSTGAHLHFQVYINTYSNKNIINPEIMLNNQKNGVNLLDNYERITTCDKKGQACK